MLDTGHDLMSTKPFESEKLARLYSDSKSFYRP